MDFCYQSTKGTRKRLVRFLYEVPRTALNLIPYYARLVAVLNNAYQDIGPPLVDLLRRDFKTLLKRHDQLHIESRIKNARFISELAKFKIVVPQLVFFCLNATLTEVSFLFLPPSFLFSFDIYFFNCDYILSLYSCE